MKKKGTLVQTLIILGGAMVGVVLLWEALSLKFDPDVPLAIDWRKIGSVVIGKLGEIVRQFIAPR